MGQGSFDLGQTVSLVPFLPLSAKLPHLLPLASPLAQDGAEFGASWQIKARPSSLQRPPPSSNLKVVPQTARSSEGWMPGWLTVIWLTWRDGTSVDHGKDGRWPTGRAGVEASGNSSVGHWEAWGGGAVVPGPGSRDRHALMAAF